MAPHSIRARAHSPHATRRAQNTICFGGSCILNFGIRKDTYWHHTHTRLLNLGKGEGGAAGWVRAGHSLLGLVFMGNHFGCLRLQPI